MVLVLAFCLGVRHLSWRFDYCSIIVWVVGFVGDFHVVFQMWALNMVALNIFITHKYPLY